MVPKPAPLNARERPLNLFDLKIPGADYTNYVDELIESRINMGQLTLPETKQYVQIIYVLLNIRDEFREEDYVNSKVLFCYSKKSKRDLKNFLGHKVDVKIFDENEDGARHYRIIFEKTSDACFFLQKSNRDFQFCRPKEFVEVGNLDYHLFVRGSKFNKNMAFSNEKLVIGPILVDEKILRDHLDHLSPLNGFRHCCNENEPYYIFEFQAEAVAPIIRTLSHLTLTDGPEENELVIRPLYQDAFVLDFNMIKEFESRVLAGPIVTSRDKTRIIQVLNLISVEDLYEHVLNCLKQQIHELCSKSGNVIKIIIPFLDKNTRPITGLRKIFVECATVEDGENVYKNIGGEIINKRVLICSYFPEFNYLIQEFD